MPSSSATADDSSVNSLGSSKSASICFAGVVAITREEAASYSTEDRY